MVKGEDHKFGAEICRNLARLSRFFSPVTMLSRHPYTPLPTAESLRRNPLRAKDVLTKSQKAAFRLIPSTSDFIDKSVAVCRQELE